jgi:hypothetical protein
MKDEKKIDKVVNAYLASLYPEMVGEELLEDHETPGKADVNRMLEKDPAKGISATSRAEISNYVKEALYVKRIQFHKWPNATPPFGYKIDKDGYLKVYKKNAQIIKWIFDRYLKTKSTLAVTHDLEDVKGIRLTKQTVWKILSRSTYIGFYHVADETAFIKELQIIDEDVFMEAQKLLKTGCDRNHEQMPPERKEKIVDRVFDEYFKALNSGDIDKEYAEEKEFQEEYEAIEGEIKEPRKRRVNHNLRSETLRFESQYIVDKEDPRITNVISKLMNDRISNETLTEIEKVLDPKRKKE